MEYLTNFDFNKNMLPLILIVIFSYSSTGFRLLNPGHRSVVIGLILRDGKSPTIEPELSSGKGFGKKNIPNVKEVTVEPLPTTAESPTTPTNTIRRSKTVREKREEELDAKIAQLESEEEIIASDPSVGAVPELVANRMIGRIAAFLGVPVFGGLGLFVAFFFLSRKYDIVVPPMMVAYATQVPFIVGLAGITYGILSASWDEKPGSLLGIEEFKINFQRIKDGLERTRKTSELRDDIIEEKKKLGRK